MIRRPPRSTLFPYTRSEEHTSELQSHDNLVCRLLLEQKKQYIIQHPAHILLHTYISLLFFFLMRRRPPRSTLFPYTTLFFFNDTATTEIYTLSLHDALDGRRII